jgi:hypothetical protein
MAAALAASASRVVAVSVAAERMIRSSIERAIAAEHPFGSRGVPARDERL